MATIGYARVSTHKQTVERQQYQINNKYKVDKWFVDQAFSGTTKAIDRPALSSLIDYVREGDTVIFNLIVDRDKSSCHTCRQIRQF